MPPEKKRRLGLTFMLLFVLGSLFIGILCGSIDLGIRETLLTLSGKQHPMMGDIIWQVRFPRVMAAFVCGGLLATAGVLLQVMLRNPLADPYILGVSGGASIGALTAMLLGASVLITHTASLIGALATIGLVFTLSYRRYGWSMAQLILTGIVLAAGLSALASILLITAPGMEVRGMLFWLMGDLSAGRVIFSDGLLMMLLLTFGIAAGKSLDVLTLGDVKAKTLGIALFPLQLQIYLLASIATAAAILIGGMIGFIGLIIPHIIRMLGINDHRTLVPAAMFCGGAFLVLADAIARTVAAPEQLPVGAVTALLGVPLLLFLLSRQQFPLKSFSRD